MSVHLRVECYSGYKADERPLRFQFEGTPDGRTFQVAGVLDRWYGIGYECFKVLADDGNLYILRHQQEKDEWVLDSFREGRR